MVGTPRKGLLPLLCFQLGCFCLGPAKPPLWLNVKVPLYPWYTL